jgi:hypothetical protein
VPGAADAISLLPLCDVRANFHDLSDDLVTRDARKRSKCLRLDECVGMAYTAGLNFDEDLSLFGVLELNVLENERLAVLLEDSGLVGLGQRRHD